MQPKWIISGLVAGGLATVCMSALMVVSKNLGIQGEHPPKRIVQGVAQITGNEPPSEPKLTALAAVAHLAFGMGAGLAFSGAMTRISKRWLILKGIGYGLGIWLVSYKGWVPKLGTLPPAEKDRPGRVATMIAGHILYGATLAESIKRLEKA